jgi:hypothetical protein
MGLLLLRQRDGREGEKGCGEGGIGGFHPPTCRLGGAHVRVCMWPNSAAGLIKGATLCLASSPDEA